ncbi:LOW QUALITY PROTEIN: hypothetical protein HID58_071405, partial [Brassica napus]
KMFLSASPIRQTGVSASVTQPSNLSVLVVSEHSLWLPRFWDSLNFKKDREFVGITVLFLDEKVNVVGQIRSVQGSGLTKETTRVVICLLIDP